MKNIIIVTCIMLVTVCLFLMISELNNKSKEITDLNKQIKNQELFIGELYDTREYKYAEELQLEIMDLGAQLDSMKLKYDEQY
jgi:cell division protein FtsL